MRKIFLSMAAALAASAVSANVEISVSSTPALPAANLIKNESFEAPKLFPWIPSGSALDTENKFSGNNGIKIPGEPAKNNNVRQNINPSNIKAGDPLYVRFAAKNVGCDLDKRQGGMAWQAYLTNGKRPYMPGVTLPREEYDWAVFENVIKAPGDIKSITFYLCYYKQEGAQYFDDVYIQGGNTELKLDVKGKNLQSIKVRHSVTGTVLAEKISGAAYSKTIKVPYFGSYSVEVTDKNGVTTSKLYPENVDANRSGDNIVQLTPGKRVSIYCQKKETFKLTLPEAAKGKKVYLEFSARADQQSPVAGYTGMIKVDVNGKTCRAAELINPKNRTKTASGGELVFTRNNGYVLYYSNACYGLSEDCSYCPVEVKDRNPFNFKLDITKLVKDGVNTITFSNTLNARAKKYVFVDNPVLVYE